MCTVIPLSLAEIAAVTAGGCTAPAAPRWSRRSSSTPAPSAPAGCSSRCPASASTGTTSPPPPSQRGAVGVLAAREVDAPAVVVPAGRRASTGTYLGDTDPDGSGAAVLAALARLAGARRRASCPGSPSSASPAAPARPRRRTCSPPCSRRWARPSPRPGRSTTSSACPGRRCAPTPTPATSCWSSPRAARATSPRWPRRCRRGSAWCSTSGSAHLGEFGSVEAIARAKGELVEALPAERGRRAQRRRPARRRDGAAHRGPGASRSARAGRDVRAEDVTLDGGPRPVPPGHARGERRRWRCGWSARTTSATRWPPPRWRGELGGTPEAVAAALLGRRARRPGGGWRSPTAPTASRWSTTPTTPTPSRCAPRCAPCAALGGGRRHLGRARADARAGRRDRGRPRRASRRWPQELGVDELVTVDSPEYGAGRAGGRRRRRPLALLRRRAGAGRRRARQGLPRRRARPGRRRSRWSGAAA